METIEERASIYALTEWISEFTDIAKKAYEAGAKEQKAIDDAELLKLKSSWEKETQINYKQGYHDAAEKACKLIDNYIADLAYPVGWADVKLLISIPERLRKAMED